VSEITQEILKDLFTYKNDELYWKVRPANRIKIGDIAGCVGNRGYRKIVINGKTYLAHRLIFLYCYGYLPEFLDHIDNNQSNNKLSNLRPATLFQNSFNSKLPKTNNSGVKGVCWNKHVSKWLAQIRHNGKHLYLGLFDDIDVAEQVIRIERVRLHGEFANHG